MFAGQEWGKFQDVPSRVKLVASKQIQELNAFGGGSSSTSAVKAADRVMTWTTMTPWKLNQLRVFSGS